MESRGDEGQGKKKMKSLRDKSSFCPMTHANGKKTHEHLTAVFRQPCVSNIPSKSTQTFGKILMRQQIKSQRTRSKKTLKPILNFALLVADERC